MKKKLIKFLRWSERYTKTDMVYVASGSFWIIFGRGGAMVSTFVVMIAFANLIPKETVGAYNYVFSVASIASIFTLSGMNEALIRAVARGKEGALWQMTRMRINWSVLGVFMLLCLSAWYFFQGNLMLSGSFLIFSFLLPFLFPFNEFTYVFWMGRNRFDVSGKYRIIHATLSAIAVIVAIFFTNSIIAIIAVYFGTQTILASIGFFWTLRKTKNKEVDLETSNFGKHLTAINAATVVANNIDSIIIWQLLGPIPAATFMFAKQPSSKLKQLIPINMLALPKLSNKLFTKKTKKEILNKFYKLFFISVPAALLLILIAPLIFKLILPTYLESAPYFQALTITIAFVPFTLLHTSLIATMKKKPLYTIQIAAPIFKICLYLVLVPLFGIWGIIYAILASQVVESGLTYYLWTKAGSYDQVPLYERRGN